MVLIKEYRIIMPMTVEEYRIGQLYSVARTQLMEATEGEGAGVEILENKPVNHPTMGPGQQTEKLYHIDRRFPPWLRAIAPKSGTILEESSTNCFPITSTTVKLPLFQKFTIKIETIHADDDGQNPNIHKLTDKQLKHRQVIYLDIAKEEDKKAKKMYEKDEASPSTFRSQKTGRGPLLPGWQKSVKPVMCAYKLVTAEFEYWPLQGKVEEYIHSYEEGLFLTYHRQLFCWIDTWHGCTIEDIRHYEKAIAERTNLITSVRAEGRDYDLKALPEVQLVHVSPPSLPTPASGSADVANQAVRGGSETQPGSQAKPPQPTVGVGSASEALNAGVRFRGAGDAVRSEMSLSTTTPNFSSELGPTVKSLQMMRHDPGGEAPRRDKDQVNALGLVMLASHQRVANLGEATCQREGCNKFGRYWLGVLGCYVCSVECKIHMTAAREISREATNGDELK